MEFIMSKIKHRSLLIFLLVCIATPVQSVTWSDYVRNRVSTFFTWAYGNITTKNISPRMVALGIILPATGFGAYHYWKSRTPQPPIVTNGLTDEEQAAFAVEEEKDKAQQIQLGKALAKEGNRRLEESAKQQIESERRLEQLRIAKQQQREAVRTYKKYKEEKNDLNYLIETILSKQTSSDQIKNRLKEDIALYDRLHQQIPASLLNDDEELSARAFIEQKLLDFFLKKDAITFEPELVDYALIIKDQHLIDDILDTFPYYDNNRSLFPHKASITYNIEKMSPPVHRPRELSNLSYE